MELSHTQRLARVLRWLITLIFILVLLLLPLIPGYVVLAASGTVPGNPSVSSMLAAMRELLAYEYTPFQILVTYPLEQLVAQIGTLSVRVKLEGLFFLGCDLCAAFILWQARHILGTIQLAEPFQMSNAVVMKRAAWGCWAVTGLALLRLLGWFFLLRNASPLFTYTSLLVPLSLVAGLLFLVISALFRQAAELKEDHDLTI